MGEGESCLGHVYNEVPPCEDAQIFYTCDIREQEKKAQGMELQI